MTVRAREGCAIVGGARCNLVVKEGSKEIVDGDVSKGELGANSKPASAYNGCLQLAKPLANHSKISSG
jgi:hypothetical protein